ncbi:putative Endonuclease/exonuclease/phosphatase, putative transposon, partial [Trachipleistophora hominis]
VSDIPWRGVARRNALDRLCNFLHRERDRGRFSEIVVIGDWNGVPSQTHRHLHARQVATNEEFLGFTWATRFAHALARRGRCIDYFVSLNNAIVGKQRVLRDVDLSDHYPVVASLAVKHITAAPDKLIYDMLEL